jgi:hypothetical protein
MSSAPRPSAFVSLTGRAARWLQLVQDLGHLDAEMTDHLLLFAAEMAANAPTDPERAVEGAREGEVWVDLPELRRAAAIVLANGKGEEEVIPQHLLEDWFALFS